MCLHGLARSGQEQLVVRSRVDAGKSESLHALNASSISRGISPARSLAMKMACSAMACSTRPQSRSESVWTPISTRYGAAREPWTLLLTLPGRTSRSIT